jgi:glycosyltransferase involved in cell wall biosynthesis
MHQVLSDEISKALADRRICNEQNNRLHESIQLGKTLRRSVDSVLAQTHTDFIYYLLDNASCDDSGAIIREYAERDSRIDPLRNEINSVGNWIWDVICGHSDDCYFCMLDADDEYTPDFFEKMLAFIAKNDLDVAVCGSVLIEEETGSLIGGAYMSEQSLILADKDSCARLFNKYLNFMYTTWGKLYKLSVLRSMNMEQYPDLSYGADTLIVTEAFRVAKRIGILAEPLHRYYISGKSISHNYDSTRVESTWAAVDAIENFLAEKAEMSARQTKKRCTDYISTMYSAPPIILQRQTYRSGRSSLTISRY